MFQRHGLRSTTLQEVATFDSQPYGEVARSIPNAGLTISKCSVHGGHLYAWYLTLNVRITQNMPNSYSCFEPEDCWVT